MTYPLVVDLARDGFPVSVTCRVLGFSTQGFYKWQRSPVSRRDYDDAVLTNAARDAHTGDPTFGYRCSLLMSFSSKVTWLQSAGFGVSAATSNSSVPLPRRSPTPSAPDPQCTTTC